jgi:hypothetical protein
MKVNVMLEEMLANLVMNAARAWVWATVFKMMGVII